MNEEKFKKQLEYILEELKHKEGRFDLIDNRFDGLKSRFDHQNNKLDNFAAEQRNNTLRYV